MFYFIIFTLNFVLLIYCCVINQNLKNIKRQEVTVATCVYLLSYFVSLFPAACF